MKIAGHFIILYMSGIIVHANTMHFPQIDHKDIIGSAVGFRPCRTEGIRIEMERSDQKLIIHNYGHCGMGITLSWGSAYEALDKLHQAEGCRDNSQVGANPEIAIIGAGVIGLTTAYVLLKNGYTVRLYARDFPPHTTSNVAGGLWSVGNRSRPRDDQLFQRLQRTSWNVFATLVNNEILRGVERMKIYAFGADPGLDESLIPAGLLPEPQVTQVLIGSHEKAATCYQTFRIDIPVYMNDLFEYVQTLGADVIHQAIHDFSEISEEIIINCSGLGARQLAHDDTVYPVRGQLLYVRSQENIDYMIFAKMETQQHPYVFVTPQSSRLVIGVTFEPDNNKEHVDEEIANTLLAHAQDFFN